MIGGKSRGISQIRDGSRARKLDRVFDDRLAADHVGFSGRLRRAPPDALSQ